MLRKKHLLSLLMLLLLAFSASNAALAQDDKKAATEENATDGGGGADNTAGDDYPYPAPTEEEYKDFVPKGRMDQQDKFMDKKYTHPARPRDQWEIGIDLGTLMISGDIHANGYFVPGAYKHGGLKYGIGGHIRKSFGHVFSLRGNFMMGTTHGENWEGTFGWAKSSIDNDFVPNKSLGGGSKYNEINQDLNGTRSPNYKGKNNDVVFYNYKTNIRELSISGIVNLNNIRFYKRETKFNLYGLVGIGGVAYRAFQDQLKGDGDNATEYDYSTVSYDLNYKSRKDVLKALSDLRDGDYESQAERHFDDYTPFKNYSFKPTAHVGVGIAHKLCRRVNIGLETRVTYTNDDLLDGQRWQEWGALTRDYDTYVFTGINANFNLGGKNSVEPLWWMNPLDYAYKELNKKPCCEDMKLPDLADDDEDGVPNAWDKQPDSRKDCPVDTHGVMLDSDRDGVLDCDDHEPHTRYDAIKNVDEHGVAPKMTCKDLGGDICDCAKKCIPPPPLPIVTKYDPCANPVLPSILFDLDKFSIKSEFESQLAEIARVMQDCPYLTLCVIGHTDVRNSDSYNNVLSYKRANEVINALVSKYNIPRSRLQLQYRGETENVVSGLSDSPAQKGIDADHGLNRRVELRLCPPGSEMSKPKGPNAGKK